MANLFDTRLQCVTNDEFIKLIDPQKIIIKTRSEYRFTIFDEIVFESRNCTMHEDIIQLSAKFPREVFQATYYDVCSRTDGDSSGMCFRYENGKDEFLGCEPQYTFINHGNVIHAFGEEVFHKLWKRIRKYLFRLDHTKESLIDGELQCDILEHHYDDCVSSLATIYAEWGNFKLSVDKSRDSELSFHGYRRNSESEEWVEIHPNSVEAMKGSS